MIPDHVNLLQVFKCIFVLVLFITSCGNPPETFKSVCNKNQGYQRIELSELIKKIEDYDGKYVEVEGEYNASPEESVLYATGFFSKRSPIHGLWILTLMHIIYNVHLIRKKQVGIFLKRVITT
ncbi:hypothetical protein A9970_11745 [Sphingobacterium sp. UME9]|nr:hypothetical protein [Sphingobacterium sp. UME9]